MQITQSLMKNTLYISLAGEMDEYSSQEARKICDSIIDRSSSVNKIIINLSDVNFMDSTGIGFLIGRFKKAKRMGIPLYIKNPNFAADKVLSLSGIYTLIPKAE